MIRQNTPSDINLHLFIGNFPDPKSAQLSKDKHIVVQTFGYTCSRKRDNQGRPYGSTQETLLDFMVIASSANQLKALYNLSKENTSSSFCFVFNPVYKEEKDGELTKCVLDTYNRALSVTGYVVEIDEVFGYGDAWVEAENTQVNTYNGFVKELEQFKDEVQEMISAVRKEAQVDSFPLKTLKTFEPLMVVRLRLLVDSIKYIAKDGKSVQMFINF